LNWQRLNEYTVPIDVLVWFQETTRNYQNNSCFLDEIIFEKCVVDKEMTFRKWWFRGPFTLSRQVVGLDTRKMFNVQPSNLNKQQQTQRHQLLAVVLHTLRNTIHTIHLQYSYITLIYYK